MHKILTPVDGSVHSLKALKIASDLAVKYNGRVILLHILMKGKLAKDLLSLDIAQKFDEKLINVLKKANAIEAGPAPNEVLAMVAQTILKHAASRAEHFGANYEIADVLEGRPADVIVEMEQSLKAGTIVMGARGVPSDQDSFFGSVSQEVFSRAQGTCISVK